MPFKSKAQQRWGNSPAGLKALGGKAKVSEWNSSTPKKLPIKVSKVPKGPVREHFKLATNKLKLPKGKMNNPKMPTLKGVKVSNLLGKISKLK